MLTYRSFLNAKALSKVHFYSSTVIIVSFSTNSAVHFLIFWTKRDRSHEVLTLVNMIKTNKLVFFILAIFYARAFTSAIIDPSGWVLDAKMLSYIDAFHSSVGVTINLDTHYQDQFTSWEDFYFPHTWNKKLSSNFW